jgi:hypothetical protein
MRTNDFTTKPTAHALNEGMFKKFGVKVNFDKYGREELENYRNLLRTKVHAQESHSNFNALLDDEGYQKDKYMLGMLNVRIKEMIGEGKKSKPDFLDLDKDGNKKEPMKKAAKDKKVKEELKGKQTKLDKNHNGKLDADDFKKLRAGKKVKEGHMTPFEAAKYHADCCHECWSGGMMELAHHHQVECEKHGGKLHFMPGGTMQLEHSGKMHSCGEGFGSAVGALGGGMAGANAGAALGGAVAGPVGSVVGGALGGFAGADAGADLGNKITSSLNRPGITGGQGTMKSTSPAMEDKKAKKDYDGDGKIESGKDEYMGSRDKAIKKAMANKSKIKESIARYIAEDEEGKAKSITAGLDMVNDFTSWMQRVATYQTKSMIELSDQIRAHFGDEAAQRFKQETGAALSQSLESLTQSREQLSNAVAVLAGEAPAQDQMGMDNGEGGMDMDQGGDMDMDQGMDDMGDDFAGADASAGGAEVTGREPRAESYVRESIARGNRLMAILGAK